MFGFTGVRLRTHDPRVFFIFTCLHILHQCIHLALLTFNPFGTAVRFWGDTTQISSRLSTKRDCGSKGVNNNIYTYEVRYNIMQYKLWCVFMFLRMEDRGVWARFYVWRAYTPQPFTVAPITWD